MTSWLTCFGSSWLLPAVLSTTAGAVDVIGFLALDGLFTAHITGNVVIVAAHYVTGGFSQDRPAPGGPGLHGSARPGDAGVRRDRARTGMSPLRPLMLLQTALLIGFLGLGVGYGRFPDANSSMAVLAGMLGVAALATQNVLVKLVLKGVPSTAVMTTNITQLTVDPAILARSKGNPDQLAQAGRRARMTFSCVIGVVVGCDAGGHLGS
jgi:uncharacterized membrane protein YoaK (UPF0700 family)